MGPLSLRTAAAQRGFSLIMSLIVLFIMTMSALSMLLLMRSGATTAGNIAFRQAAVRVADVGVEDARTFLDPHNHDDTYKKDNHSNDAYFASYDPSFLPGSFDFLNNGHHVSGGKYGRDYDVYYVIHRMALTAGSPCSDPLAGCMFPPTASSTGTQSGQTQVAGTGSGQMISASTGLVYYRVTVKVVGPRFNNRYVQAFMY